MTEVQTGGPSTARTWLVRTAGVGLIAAAAAIGSTATADAAPASTAPPANALVTATDSGAALAACKKKTHGNSEIVQQLWHIPFTHRYVWACMPGLQPS